MPPSLLEPDYADAYSAWSKSPTPDANAAMLKTLHPVIEGAVKTHIGTSNPLLLSSARRLTLEGLRSYDPSKGKLQTHLYNHLQGLKRIHRRQTMILSAPERVLLDRYHLDQAGGELSAELGREPTDAELANKTGFSPKRMGKVRQYHAALTEGGAQAEIGGDILGGSTVAGAQQSLWPAIVYDDLDPYHQKVMEYGFGLNGHRRLQNQDIARKLNRSPGAISQAKLRIQKKLDEEQELSPFT